MKHLKKLSVAVMMVTLFSVSFTSCIDNEVSPVVEAIYGAQADLLAAQAGVQNAEAAYLLAQANAENANAAWRNAQAAQVAAYTAGIVEGNAYEALRHEQYLLQLVASTNAQVAAAENAMALAQVQFEVNMAAAIAAMEAAGAQLAVGYAFDYRWAMEAANSILSQKLSAENSLAQAMLLQTGGVSYAYWLAQLQNNVTTAMADKVNLENAIADLQAYMADPTTTEAIISGLKEQNLAYQDAIDAKEIEIAEQNIKIQAILNEGGVRNTFVDRFEVAESDLNDATAEKTDREGWISDAQDDIDGWQLALDDYPAAIAAAELAVTNAETAQTAAQTAVDDAIDAIGVEILPAAMAGDDAIDPAVTLYEILWNADLAVADAQTAKDDLQLELDALYPSYQAAIDALALAQSNYDAGIDAIELAVTDAQTALDDANDAWTDANNYYLLKKGIFEDKPAGLTWFDQTTPLGGFVAESFPAFPNTRIGLHTDAIATSYAYVTGWVEAPLGTWTATTISAGMVTAIPGTAFTYTGPELSATMPSVSAATGFYVELEADDLSETNADLLDDAVAKLGNDIAVDPVLGDSALLTTDAYSVVWNAQLALLEAQDVLANFGTAKDDAYAVYIYQKGLYENQVDLMNAAQTVLDDAEAAQTAAQDDIDDAEAALGTIVMPAPLAGDDAIDPAETLYEVLWNADLAVLDAEAALDALEVCDDVCLQGNIDQAILDIAAWNTEIALIQPLIDSYQAILDDLQVEYDAYLANEALLATTPGDPGYADLQAQIIAEYQVLWVLQQEKTAIENASDLNDDLIDAYGWATDDLADLAVVLSGLQSDLADAMHNIELVQQALASGQVQANAAAAQITYWQAIVATLGQRHANALAIAAKYKALMDAALAS
ncbi:MAG: hypothetical protein CVU08_12425 [Bacteroidetes bacterium HGW-Bacteroidetes-3]|nr:MAG: hypothetical protein CVU08_12425 [Bacteroidetes bacterium HGW-Bacteroidetes-3]